MSEQTGLGIRESEEMLLFKVKSARQKVHDMKGNSVSGAWVHFRLAGSTQMCKFFTKQRGSHEVTPPSLYHQKTIQIFYFCILFKGAVVNSLLLGGNACFTYALNLRKR